MFDSSYECVVPFAEAAWHHRANASGMFSVPVCPVERWFENETPNVCVFSLFTLGERFAHQVFSAVSRANGQRTFAFNGQKLPKHRFEFTDLGNA